jgi:hypothetical protein
MSSDYSSFFSSPTVILIAVNISPFSCLNQIHSISMFFGLLMNLALLTGLWFNFIIQLHFQTHILFQEILFSLILLTLFPSSNYFPKKLCRSMCNNPFNSANVASLHLLVIWMSILRSNIFIFILHSNNNSFLLSLVKFNKSPSAYRFTSPGFPTAYSVQIPFTKHYPAYIDFANQNLSASESAGQSLENILKSPTF